MTSYFTALLGRIQPSMHSTINSFKHLHDLNLLTSMTTIQAATTQKFVQCTAFHPATAPYVGWAAQVEHKCSKPAFHPFLAGFHSLFFCLLCCQLTPLALPLLLGDNELPSGPLISRKGKGDKQLHCSLLLCSEFMI